MSSGIRHRWFGILLGALIIMGLPSGCQKDNTTAPETNSSDLRIGSVEITESSLGPDESTEVRVWVVNGPDPGTPVEGIEVSFKEMTQPVSGAFSKDTELSDATGWATVTYQPSGGKDGTVYLRLQVGEDKEYREIQVGSTPTDGVSLSFATATGQSSIAADGQSSVAMTVTASRGLSAAPLANALVTLVAGDQFVDLDGDGVFTGTDQLVGSGDANGNGLWDAEGSLPEQVRTDVNGQAIFVYEAGDTERTVYLKATVEGVSSDFALFQHPTSLQVTAEVSSRELLADGVSQTSVRAMVSDWSGSPIEGVILYFVAGEPFTDANLDGYYTEGFDTYDDSNANGQWDAVGTIESVVTTGGDGAAWATYTAGLTQGPVTIRATSSSGSAVAVLELVPVPNASVLDLMVDPGTLPADGVSLATGSVQVRDVNGALVTGKKINLVAGDRFDDVNGDGVFTPGTDELLTDANGDLAWTEVGTLPSETFTNDNGMATFEYQAGLEPATVWIRASADGVSTEASIELQNLPTAWSIEVNSSEEVLAVQGAGGVDNARILAQAFDSRGNTVPAGIPIEFRLVTGPGGGEQIQGAVGGVYESRTNSNGEAEAVLSAGTMPGLITVEVNSGPTRRTLGVTVGAGLAHSITARTTEAEIDFWNTTSVEAVVQDAYGNAVEDGTVVQFSTDEGLIVGSDGPGLSRTVGGMAVAEYQSLGPASDTDYLAEISITVPNTSAEASVDLPLIAPSGSIVDVLRMGSSQSEIAPQGAGGVEEAVLTVQAFDNQGRTIGSGYEVSFEIMNGPNGGENLNGLGWGPVALLTDANGQASIILRSGSSSGPIEVEASYENITTSLEVGMASQDVAAIECLTACVSLGWNETCEEIDVIVYDQHHNAVPDGTVVWFSANEGLVIGSDGGGTSLTQNGVATASYTATGEGGQAIITAKTVGGQECNTLIAVQQTPDEITNLLLTVSAPEIGVSGTGASEQTTVFAQGVDQYGQAVGADVPVTFRIAQGPGGGERFLGSDGPATVVTDASGTAKIALAAGTVSGTVVVEASAGTGISEATSIAIAAGPPANIYVGIGACNVLACSRVNVENTVVAVVSDIYNNPVKDGTSVYYTVDKGVVHGDETGGLGSDITFNGVAGGIWRSGDSCEWVKVTASTDGGLVSNEVSFIASDDPYSATIQWPTADVIELAADGEREVTIWTEVLDWNGMYVLPTELDWETEFGEITENDETEDGCNGSIGRSVYRSSTLDRDWSVTTPDDGVGAIDIASVTSGFGGIGDFLTIRLLTSVANSDESEVELSGAATPLGTISFVVTVKDRYGNPLGGHTLEGSASAGAVGALSTTNLWGQSTGFYTAPAATGEVTLTIADTDPNFGGMILVEVISVN